MTAQVSFLRTRPLWNIIRLGITLAALAPAVVSSFGPSIQSVVAFVLILTLGDDCGLRKWFVCGDRPYFRAIMGNCFN